VANISEIKTDFTSRRMVVDKINAAFSKFDPDYLRKKRRWQAKLDVVSQRLLDMQAAGNPMFRSDQIEIEARWLINYGGSSRNDSMIFGLVWTIGNR
jgi:hypothetical protein